MKRIRPRWGETLVKAQTHLLLAGGDARIREGAADKGYHSSENLVMGEEWGIRTYIPERASPHRRRWSDKPPSQQHAVYGNRRRVKADRGRKLGRLRSEYVERSFAHTCETGGARRSWLHGLEEVTKRYVLYMAGRNLGVIMRALFGMGKPKTLPTEGGGVFALLAAPIRALMRVFRSLRDLLARGVESSGFSVAAIFPRQTRCLRLGIPVAA
ncbi:MAG: hypothetical protein EDS66_14655 [Planctomycetota bacterium]|nr:MAG: hypothetical protein EDS66_14655 [Planctomycetota bacterium]KAB2948607.1 MAG: hypothetical protein F9K17_06020 [Phycisphaerae bacterium]MCQ3922393.1 hypothetical protein [Planctomycetota bacterium]